MTTRRKFDLVYTRKLKAINKAEQNGNRSVAAELG